MHYVCPHIVLTETFKTQSYVLFCASNILLFSKFWTKSQNKLDVYFCVMCILMIVLSN